MRRASEDGALSFLYRAFSRVLELIRLSRRDDMDLAIEIIVRRHEVAVRDAKSTGRCCRPQTVPFWLGCHGCSPVIVSGASSSNR